MRGRKPNSLTLRPGDEPILHQIARSQTLAWFQVRRARTILALAAGARTGAVAAQMQCDEATIWRDCQRYRHDGLAGLLDDRRQGNSGRPAAISPPPACSDC
jgi:Winged helix-turn helix